MTHDRSTDQIVALDMSGPIATMDSKRKPARFTLDFATWRAHIAAPGSRFEPAQPASPRIVRLDAVSRAASAEDAERRTA